jgi:hypothetical protein
VYLDEWSVEEFKRADPVAYDDDGLRGRGIKSPAPADFELATSSRSTATSPISAKSLTQE